MSLLSSIRTLALGAAAMYYLDPNRGRARRANLASQCRRLVREGQHYARIAAKRSADRSRGVTARLNARLATEPVDDAQLEARVRSRLGRLVRHPGSIETEVSGGRLRLRGPVLADELNRLMAGLWHVRGVTAIDNQLSVHDRPAGVPGLQGQRRRGQRPGPWSRPLLLALGGGALACGSLHRGALFRGGAYATGATLLLNAWLAPAAQRRATQPEPQPEAPTVSSPLAAGPAGAERGGTPLQ